MLREPSAARVYPMRGSRRHVTRHQRQNQAATPNIRSVGAPKGGSPSVDAHSRSHNRRGSALHTAPQIARPANPWPELRTVGARSGLAAVLRLQPQWCSRFEHRRNRGG